MGADKPQMPFPSSAPKTRKTWPFVLAGALVLIVCALKWSDVVEYINGEPSLNAKHQQQLEKKLAELEEGEQYALIATKEGFYPCLHSGHPLYFIHVGEVWRYGTTIKGQRGRYSSKFMKENAVSYIVEFRGPMGVCLQREQI